MYSLSNVYFSQVNESRRGVGGLASVVLRSLAIMLVYSSFSAPLSIEPFECHSFLKYCIINKTRDICCCLINCLFFILTHLNITQYINIYDLKLKLFSIWSNLTVVPITMIINFFNGPCLG